jgi:hypothetical protein
VPEGDSYTIAIAHKLGTNHVVIDAIREMRPPFNASEVKARQFWFSGT